MTPQAAIALCDLQDAFAEALLADRAIEKGRIAALASQPGFAVYRNGVMTHAIDALAASFPAVSTLVGPAFFRAAAAHYVRVDPPRSPMLVTYGAGFAEFLRHFEPAAEIAYLADVARVERMWTEAHVAASDTTLDAAVVAALTAAQLQRFNARPHASARWGWFENAPIHTLWQQNRVAINGQSQIEWRSEGVLLVCTRGSVESLLIDASTCAFLDRCARGACLEEAIDAALRIDARCDLEKMIYRLLTISALSRLQCIDHP